MNSEPQTPPRRTDLVQRFTPREAADDLPDRCTTRNDREYGRTTPGQAWLQQSRRTQPCAQRIEIVPVLPQKLFEAIAPPDECQRFNSLAPNGCGKSAVVFPVCQAISGLVVSPEGVDGRNLPRRHGHDGAQWRSKFHWGKNLPPPRPERRAAGESERHVRTELQRVSRSLHPGECSAVKREERRDRGRSVCASAPHARPRRDPFDEREVRTSRERERAPHEPGGAEHEVPRARRHEAPGAHRQAAAECRILVADAEREAPRAPPRDERVRQRHRLEHRHQLVKAVQPARTHGEPQVELRSCLDRDRARGRAAHRAW